MRGSETPQKSQFLPTIAIWRRFLPILSISSLPPTFPAITIINLGSQIHASQQATLAVACHHKRLIQRTDPALSQMLLTLLVCVWKGAAIPALFREDKLTGTLNLVMVHMRRTHRVYVIIKIGQEVM